MECKQCKKILVATDGSDNFGQAMSFALGLAKSSGAMVYTVYVVSNVSMYAGTRDVSWAESMNEHFFREGETANNVVIEEGKAHGVEVKAEILEGNPGEEILDFAEANDIDMIAMGTKGGSGVNRFLLGSVAEKVVRHSKVPVLVVPNDAACIVP